MRGAVLNLLILLGASACVAGSASTGGGGGNPDAALTDARRPTDARPIDAPGSFTCRDKVTVGLDNGHHNPGQNCQQGCHNHNFYMSGTMFSSATGGAPVVGASLTFVDADGNTGDMVTNLNGNFWWSLPVTFPVKIIASSCPDIRPMTAMVTSTGGGCNQNGCHVGGNRIHLP